MHQIMEYSAVVGAGWVSSNVLFVIAWSWLHSRKRRWMSDDGTRPSIFTVRSDTAYFSTVSPHYLSGSVTVLGPVDMPVNRAS
jgi:hypothetical protein